ncbi:MAG: hypothetical protein ACE5K3_07660 [bacterium]
MRWTRKRIAENWTNCKPGFLGLQGLPEGMIEKLYQIIISRPIYRFELTIILYEP